MFFSFILKFSFCFYFSFQWQIVIKDHQQLYQPHRQYHRRIAMLLNVLMLHIQIAVRHLDKKDKLIFSFFFFFSFPNMSLLFNMDFHWRLCVCCFSSLLFFSLFFFFSPFSFFWSIRTNIFNTLDVDLNSDPIVIRLRTEEENVIVGCQWSVGSDRPAKRFKLEKKNCWWVERVDKKGRMIVDWEIFIS